MSKPDKLVNKILFFMNQNGAGCYCSIATNWDSEASIPFGQICKAVNAGEAEVRAAVAYMVKHDLAEYGRLSSKSGPINISFRLNHEGLHYKEFQRLTQVERWKERAYGFFSGVLISVLAGIIIEWLLK